MWLKRNPTLATAKNHELDVSLNYQQQLFVQVTPVSRFADSSEWCKLFDRWKSKQHKNVSNSRQNFEQIYGSVRQIVLSVNYQLGSPFPEIDLWPTYDGTMVLV